MRLIDAKKFVAEEQNFFVESQGEASIAYAIVSHRWEGEEISYQDMRQPNISPHLRECKGYRKVLNACYRALKDCFSYIWIDTCKYFRWNIRKCVENRLTLIEGCIDRTSSSELQEAINSMFHWYEESMVCYVYLSDLAGSCPSLSDEYLNHDKYWESAFKNSAWFTRAWTLQELLAPRRLIFYSASWSPVCSLRDVVEVVSSRTRIDVSILLHETSLATIPVSKRMSWAADRKATRTEDVAYSLIGIFDVNMPMLYGERSQAFIRLQEHIIRACTDQTVFTSDTGSHLRSEVANLPPPLLARSPRGFLHSDITRLWRSSNAFELTNAGLRLRTNLLHMHDGHYAAVLDSRTEDESVPETYVHALKLIKRQSSGGGIFPETYQIVDRHCKACASRDCVYSMSFLPARLIDVDKANINPKQCKDFIVAYGDYREIDRHNVKRKTAIQVSLNGLLSLDEARPRHVWEISTRRKPEMQIPESFFAPRKTSIDRNLLKPRSDFIRGYLQLRNHAGCSVYLVVTAQT